MISTSTILYIYDNTILTWLRGLEFSKSVYGEGFISPSEVVSVTWGKKDPVFGSPTPDTYLPNNLPTYPIVSLISDDPVPDVSRRFIGSIRGYDTIDEKLKKVRYPIPFKVPYQIDLLARNIGHIKQMYVELLMEFETNVKYLIVPLPDPIKSKYVKLTLLSITDNSDLELDNEGQMQLYRKTLNIEADIYLFKDTYPTLQERVGTVDIRYEVDNGDVVELDEIESQ